MLDVVEEVKVVEEPRGLRHAQAQEGVHAALARVEDLHGVVGRQHRRQLGRQPSRAVGLVALPAGGADGERLVGEEDEREGHAERHGKRGESPAVRRGGQLGDEQHEGEGRQRIEVVLPALALGHEVKGAIEYAERRHRVARAEPPRCQRGDGRE